ncbi:MAG TPA: LL-diaminopimelate aminotransferase [Actinomycetota bacterium]|nr:LL-diaminopimelate aminotransferase [Actinomycetota bacterium]
MRIADRVANLPPYLFAELDRKIAEKQAAGADVISLGVGDPDTPTPKHIVDALKEAADDPATHRYPSYFGMPALRKAVAEFYGKRFGVELDPDTEVQPLIGSKEGIAHLAWAMVDPGDEVLVPDPGYPVYEIGTRLAGGTPVPLPHTAENGFLPDLASAKPSAATKVLWLGFPSNPTAAVAELGALADAVSFAREHDLLLAHDVAYSEITFDGFVAPSVLQVQGGKDVAVEFGSASKTYNMTGWRVGWAVGNPDAIRALSTLKTNLDSGIFDAVQRAAIAALTGPQDHLEALRSMYARRRDTVIEALNGLGWDLKPPLGSFYVWFPTRDGMSSAEFCELVLDKAAVVLAPGAGYGSLGEGWARISLTVPDERLEEAMERLRNVLV